MSGRVVPFPKKSQPSRKELADKVRLIAGDPNTINIRFDHPHAKNQMAKRNVSMRQVLEVLRHGQAVSGPTLDKYGDWRIKLRRKVAGRKVQVVVAVKETHFVVVTVI